MNMEHLSKARSILARALNVTAETIGDRATIDELESWDADCASAEVVGIP